MVGIIPFPMFKINFEHLVKNEKHCVKEVSLQRPLSGKNYSISYLENSIPCFKINFEIIGENDRQFVTEMFKIGAWKQEI